MKLKDRLPILSSTNPRLLTGAGLLIVALGLLVVLGDQARAQEGGEEPREGYEKRLADRIARYQEANAERAATGLISNVPTGLQLNGSGEFTVSATGLDSDPSFQYDFDIGSSGASIRFDSDCTLSYTGVMVPPGDPDHEENVTVHACEKGRSTITVNLYEYSVDEDETYLLDTDVEAIKVNTPPVFNPDSYSFVVPQTASVGTRVGEVIATDSDNDPLTYSITAGNTGSAFTISATDSGAGQITTARALSGLTTSSYSLTARVDDGDGGQDTATVNITLTDENVPPEFISTPYDFEFPKNAVAGTNVGSVYARDADSDPLTFSIIEGDPANGFYIVPSGSTAGQITLARNHSSLTTISYSLTVRVDDGNGGDDTEIVSVEAVNERPVFNSKTYNFEIPKNSGAGTRVGEVSATDADHDPLTYSITRGNTGNAFAIVATGSDAGQIAVARNLAGVNTSFYSLTVGVSDGDRGQDTATVQVTLVNRPPVFSSDTYEFDVPEDAIVGAGVGSVSATDPDNDPLTYSITGGNTGNDFSIGSSSGEITVARGLDYDITSLYLLTVTANDGDRGVATGYVDITVEVVNQAPTITGGSSFVTYPENSTHVVSTYTASDPDGDNVAWTLAGNDRARFSIGAVSGQLSFRAPPDFEGPTDVGRDNRYNVRVVATDDASNPLSSYRDVTIRVSNVNEAPEVATQIPDQVLSAADSPLTFDLTARFSDPDSDALRYDASSSAPGVVGESVNGNILTLTPGVAGTARVTVTAYDRLLGVVGVLSASQSFAVEVQKVAPDQMAAPTLVAGDGSLAVKWVPPYNGGAQITRYEIRYILTTAPPPTPWDLVVSSNPSDTEKTIGGMPNNRLVNGSDYYVQVRACNGPANADCGSWSPSATGTPTDPKLAKPENLQITPLSLRRAKLTWTGDPDADQYRVVAEYQVGASLFSQGFDLTSEAHVIELDKIVGDTGLAHEDYFTFRVVAKDTTGVIPDSDPSEDVMITDNPLLHAGGKAKASGSSQAKLEWTPDANASNYEIRYRPLGEYDGGEIMADHTSIYWSTGLDWPYPGAVQTASQDSPGNKTITGLTEGEIYAFQVNYEKGGKDVFSVRDAYVWPSSDFPGNDGRVATYPFFGHHQNGEFEYVICESHFPPNDWVDWQDIITAAFEEWETAAGPLVTVTRNTTGDCATGAMSDFIMADDAQSEVRMLDTTRGRSVWSFSEVKSDVFKGFCLTDGTDPGGCTTSFTGYTGISHDDEKRREILDLLADDDLSMVDQIRGYFKLIGSERKAENVLQGVDVTFNRRNVDGSEKFTLNKLKNPDTVRFNTCLNSAGMASGDPDTEYYAYSLSVHEAGHALGLSNITLDPLVVLIQPYHVAHPTIPDSALNYNYEASLPGGGVVLEEHDCSPHPFDVTAIHALYQTAPIVSISGPTSGSDLTQVTLRATVVDNLTAPFSYQWSSGPWALSFSPNNTSTSVTVTLPDVDSNDPVEQRQVTVEVIVTDTNGKVGRDRHVITVVP